jgi:hypothetical protein
VASLDPTVWIPIFATWILVVGTLAFAYWQLRQNRRLHSTTTLLDLRDRFYSQRMREARRTLAGWLLKEERPEDPENWEVGLFFELLGSLTRAGDIDRRLVRNAFGTWVTAYYLRFRKPLDLLTRWRKESNDDDVFADFEWLATWILAQDRRGSTPGPELERSMQEDAAYVLERESRLDVGA